MFTGRAWGEPDPERLGASTLRTIRPESVGPRRVGPQGPEDDLPERVADRYQRRELLGRGGMGSVWRVWDEVLTRPVAMKVVRADLVGPHTLERFADEARIAARLQHPGIVPVHDLGELEDGRLWFTMKEVEGRTLEELLRDVHRAWRLGMEVTDSGFTFRRMLEAYLRVCETVAYAHAHGVVHRDIKPSNVMVGAFGEVLVLDWGLAKVLGGPDPLAPLGGEEGTLGGAITGTPAYMSPEQARGSSSEVGPEADVYALGATLYDLLAERPPRLDSRPERLLERVARGAPVPPPSRVTQGPPIDEELDHICLRALAHAEGERYPTAAGLVADLARWLDGARKREQAMAFVAQADALVRQADRDDADAADLDARAEQHLAALPAYAPADAKAPGWDLEDQARAARRRAEAARTRSVQLLRAALSHAPDLAAAHDRLADRFHARHVALEREGRDDDLARVEADLRQHDRSGRYAAYLSGVGRITLVTDPPGAEVRLFRLEESQRRMKPMPAGVLGRTPLEADLPMGSYLLTLHLPGHEEVRYPVTIGRQEHWDGAPPGQREPAAVALPRTGELGADDVYVPAGWFWSGDRRDTALPLRRLWSDAFVIRRFPVTVGEYVRYLDRLVAAGREEEAVAAQPYVGDTDEPFFARAPDGRFLGIRDDKEGPGWAELPRSPRAPAVYIDWNQARAYAAAEAVASGLDWRLPMELEWQKSARGADRWAYPWGDHFEPTWCRMRFTAPVVSFVEVDDHPEDVSVYGVRGLAGNVADWVLDPNPFEAQGASERILVGVYPGARRIAAGGSCGSGKDNCRIGARSTLSAGFVAARLGFRLCRRFPDRSR